MPVRYDPDTTKSFSERRGKPKSGGAATARSSVPRSDAMNNPVVLITGALTGIGRAAALAFAAEGSRIVVSGRHEEAGQGLATELRPRRRGRVHPCRRAPRGRCARPG